MELVLGAGLVLAALAFVVYPLLRSAPDRHLATALPADEVTPSAGRQAIYREMLELDLDLRLGKLSETHHRELSDALLARAAALLAEEDARAAEIGERIEHEIAAMRGALQDLEHRSTPPKAS